MDTDTDALSLETVLTGSEETSVSPGPSSSMDQQFSTSTKEEASAIDVYSRETNSRRPDPEGNDRYLPPVSIFAPEAIWVEEGQASQVGLSDSALASIFPAPSTLVVPITVSGKETMAVVDTAAQMTIVNDQLYELTDPPPLSEVVKIGTAGPDGTVW